MGLVTNKKLCKVIWGIIINPFTAPACTISGLKVHEHPCKESTSRLYITSTFDAMRLDENPFTYQYKMKKEKVKGFQISHF